MIPAVNEAEHLPLLLSDLAAQQGVALECIVVDGGSTDDTIALAHKHGAIVHCTAKGRALQMNAGASIARAPWLLFLHADSRISLPLQLSAALKAMHTAGAPKKLRAGHWPLKFTRNKSGHDYLFRYLEGKTRSQRRFTINGDQGTLISRASFDLLGGFDTSLPHLEDQRFAAKIFASGQWVLLPGELHTSARRFEVEGYESRLTLMLLMMALHDGGVHDFFKLAPKLYQQQSAAQSLSLEPFGALIHQLIWQDGVINGLLTLRRIGHFTAENAWQLAHAIDALVPQHNRPAMQWFERYIEPHLPNPVIDLAASVLGYAWFCARCPPKLPLPSALRPPL